MLCFVPIPTQPSRRAADSFVASGEDIAAIAACFGCSPECAALLMQSTVERTFNHRQPIAYRGDPSDCLFLVLTGAVVSEIFGAEGQQAQLTQHGPGELFGAYPEATTHRADLCAQGETRMLAIPTAKMEQLARENAKIGAGLTRLMARQLDLVLDRMAARIGLSASGRFHRALLQLADECGHIEPAPVISALALSVHTTRETGSRAISTLVRRGIIERHDNALRIVSRRLLEEMVI